jgi:hypothetical protein
MAYIYKHIRKDTNEVFYIGIGENNRRITSTNNRNSHWKNIVNKFGYDAEIIEDGLTWEEACNKETEWIKHYGRRDLNEGTLVNLTNGGDGTFGKIVSTETRKKQSNSKLGKNNPLFGKTRDDHSNWLLNNHPNKKIVYQYTLDDIFVKKWICAREVFNTLGISYKNISSCCLGKRNTAGGFKWKYIN